MVDTFRGEWNVALVRARSRKIAGNTRVTVEVCTVFFSVALNLLRKELHYLSPKKKRLGQEAQALRVLSMVDPVSYSS